MTSETKTRDRCELCDLEFRDVHWELQNAGRDYNHRYVRCQGCGLVTVSPYRNDPGIGLTHEGHVNYVNDIETYAKLVSIEAFLYMLNLIESNWHGSGQQGRGRLLEIGSAAGYLLDAARARGWSVTGIEPAEASARWSRTYLQLPVHQGFYHEVEIPDASFDVVTAIEVVEHVLDPFDFVRWIRQKLRPGGMIYLTTPNVESPRWSAEGDAPFGIYEPLDHMNLFSEVAMARTLEQAGFRDVLVRSDGPGGFQLQARGFCGEATMAAA